MLVKKVALILGLGSMVTTYNRSLSKWGLTPSSSFVQQRNRVRQREVTDFLSVLGAVLEKKKVLEVEIWLDDFEGPLLETIEGWVEGRKGEMNR